MNYDDILVNEDVIFNEKKGRAVKDGYYVLYLCDFEKGSRGLLKSNKLGENGQSHIIGVLKNGIMFDYISKIKLDFVDDVGVIYDKSEEFYYFEKPCYVNCKRISLRKAYDFLCSYDDNENLINSYIEVINDQFVHAVSGYNEMKESVNKEVKIRKKM